MKVKRGKLLGIILLWVLLFSFFPESTVGAIGGDITTNTTWSGLIELTQDVRVTNGATLTILPGTTVRVISDDDADGGIDPDLVEIIIENGFLEVDSASFEGNDDYGWYGSIS